MKPVHVWRFPIFISLIFVCLLTLSLNGSLLAQPSNQKNEPPIGEDGLLQPSTANRALQFNGRDQYVSFGPAPHLGAETFTLELWFRWDGGGVTTNTGVDGVVAYPLLTKGRPEGDHTAADMNYFLGIRGSDQVLVADLEEGAQGFTPGQNHPITGVTPVVEGEWTHAAATYDGRQWQLFLNGKMEAEIVVDQPVRSDSIQHAALATALNSKGAPAGYFAGAIDEVRIWDKALSEQEIRANINVELDGPQPHLLARWGLDEDAGANVVDSAALSESDVATTNSMTTVPGAPFNIVLNDAPFTPVLVQPADSAVNVATSPTLSVAVTDPEADDMTVTFYGRPLTTSNSDFTLVAMPDTQKYAERFSPIFAAQTQWVVDNKNALNIAHVMQLGDCVENGDEAAEWEFADAAFSLIEDPSTTGLTHGIPYSITVGNHDQTPFDDPDGDSTALYNHYFGSARFSGRDYYGGYYGSNFDNHYELFSAGGMDFIIISLEYAGASSDVLTWADNVLNTYSNRRAIVISHYIINTGNPGSWGGQGRDIYDALKDRPNLFLMHSGHRPGEGQRVDTHNGNTVNTIVADYQSRQPDGGNGLLRILEFSPNNNEIRVKTYSPTLDEYETDSDSQFTFSYDMQGAVDFVEIGQVSGVASGTNASMTWPGLRKSTEYEWYVTMDDGTGTTTGPTWSFTTGSQQPPAADFSGLPTAGPAPLNVNFDNLTTGDYETCAWDFGDGSSTKCDDLSHTYNTPGTYPVMLSVDGPLGPSSTTKNDYITVYNPAVAGFTAGPTGGIVPLQVSFSNLATGDYDTCFWEFGDNKTSSDCNDPQHIYTVPGSYAVSLTVSGNGGSQKTTKPNYITVNEAGNANFSADPRQGIAPLTTKFTNLSLGNFNTCQWDFGDGSTSQECNNPAHTYTAPGTYSVSLAIDGPGGSDSVTFTDLISVSEPLTADFSGDPRESMGPFTVNFTNLSSGDYLTCLWEFGDGSSLSQCDNPSHFYAEEGTYAVSLTVEGPGGSDTKTLANYVSVTGTVSFSATPTSGQVPLTVTFNIFSTDQYNSCLWDFGDGATSSACSNISHTFTSFGTYTVELTLAGPSGSNSAIKVDYISVEPRLINLPLILHSGG